MSTVWGARNRSPKVLVFLGFRHRGTIVTTVDNAFSLSCGVGNRFIHSPVTGLSQRSLPRQGRRRAAVSPGGKNGKTIVLHRCG